jgi:hypothetical protein
MKNDAAVSTQILVALSTAGSRCELSMSTFDIDSDLAALFDLLPGTTPAEPETAPAAQPVIEPALPLLPTTSPAAPAAPAPQPAAPPTIMSPFAVPPVAATVVTTLAPPTVEPAPKVDSAPVVLVAPAAPQPGAPRLPSLPSMPARAVTASVGPTPIAGPVAPSAASARLFPTAQPLQPTAPLTRRQRRLERRRGLDHGRQAAKGGSRIVRYGLAFLVMFGGTMARIAVREGWVFKDDQPSAQPAAVRTAAVDAWDPRVAEMVTFVETTRGLEFTHPVQVDFLVEADFIALFAQPELSESDLEFLDQYSDVFDAAGLAVDYDPAAASQQLAEVTTLGFYSLDEDRVYVRGEQLTPAVQVVLAHELTHALQAQHFDLETTRSNDLKVRSIVEADAMRVEQVYLDSLQTNEAFSAEEDNTVDATTVADISTVPWAVVVKQYAPYELGPRLVSRAFAAGGNAAVDELIRNPPSEERLVNPWLDAASTLDTTIDVTAPEGAEVLDGPRQLGLLDTLVMLDAWLPWTQSRQAVAGWSGGGHVSYVRADGVVCFTSTAAFDSDPAPFAAAVSAWAAASGSTTTPVIDGLQVSFEACDRGPGALPPPEPVLDPLYELYIENDVLDLAGPNPTPEVLNAGLCYAHRLIDDPALAPLLHEGDSTAEEDAALDYLKQVNGEICGFAAFIQPR